MTDHETATVATFAAFVARARVALPHTHESADAFSDFRAVSAFQRFAARAVPLVVADIHRHLPALAARAALAEKWLVRDDLLSIAGYRYAENAYTELMAWALRPDTHLPSARARQSAWLDTLGCTALLTGRDPVVPRTQVRTDDGIPDLVLQFGPHVVCLEAKTGSAEHAAPSSGRPQSLAYPDAVRDAFRLPVGGRVWMAFITPDGRPAANPDATRTTYVKFALAMIRGLTGFDLPLDTWAMYAVLFTHLFGSGVPAGTSDVPALIRRVAIRSRQGGWDAPEQVQRHRHDLVRAISILLPEETS